MGVITDGLDDSLTGGYDPRRLSHAYPESCVSVSHKKMKKSDSWMCAASGFRHRSCMYQDQFLTSA
jgi:hypothetical protein